MHAKAPAGRRGNEIIIDMDRRRKYCGRLTHACGELGVHVLGLDNHVGVVARADLPPQVASAVPALRKFKRMGTAGARARVSSSGSGGYTPIFDFYCFISKESLSYLGKRQPCHKAPMDWTGKGVVGARAAGWRDSTNAGKC